MIIGVTGSFGSGKTTVANMFGKYGFKVINVDKLYRTIFNKNNILKNKIKKEVGTLDRNKIKKIVFNDYKKLKKLNSITHPIIIEEIKKQINAINKKFNKKISINKKSLKKIKNNKIESIIKKINKNLSSKSIKNKSLKINNKKIFKNSIKIIIDAPLLIETNALNLVDKLIVVKCSRKHQFQRILKKNKYSKKEINQIIKSQMPLKQKLKYADFIVDNDSDLNKTRLEVRGIISAISTKTLKTCNQYFLL